MVYDIYTVVLEVVDIDPKGSIGPSKGSINGHGVEWGSLNNCWSLLEQWSLQFKIIVNRARNANGVFNKSNKIKRVDQISATIVWKYIRFEVFY